MRLPEIQVDLEIAVINRQVTDRLGCTYLDTCSRGVKQQELEVKRAVGRTAAAFQVTLVGKARANRGQAGTRQPAAEGNASWQAEGQQDACQNCQENRKMGVAVFGLLCS